MQNSVVIVPSIRYNYNYDCYKRTEIESNRSLMKFIRRFDAFLCVCLSSHRPFPSFRPACLSIELFIARCIWVMRRFWFMNPIEPRRVPFLPANLDSLREIPLSCRNVGPLKEDCR